MNLILLRHGQSTWNLENRFTGWKDVSLTEIGIEEAEYSGKIILENQFNIQSIYTSLLNRATETTNIVAQIINYPKSQIKIDWRLNERHYGALEGLNKSETAKKYGEEQVKIWRRSFDIPPPKMESDHPYKDKIKSTISSESLKDTFDRVVPYFNKKIKPLILDKKNILVVFHGNSCRALLMNILNISKEKIIELEIPTANPLLVRFEKDLEVKDFRYLDEKREKKILFNI